VDSSVDCVHFQQPLYELIENDEMASVVVPIDIFWDIARMLQPPEFSPEGTRHCPVFVPQGFTKVISVVILSAVHTMFTGFDSIAFPFSGSPNFKDASAMKVST